MSAGDRGGWHVQEWRVLRNGLFIRVYRASNGWTWSASREEVGYLRRFKAMGGIHGSAEKAKKHAMYYGETGEMLPYER